MLAAYVVKITALTHCWRRKILKNCHIIYPFIISHPDAYPLTELWRVQSWFFCLKWQFVPATYVANITLLIHSWTRKILKHCHIVDPSTISHPDIYCLNGLQRVESWFFRHKWQFMLGAYLVNIKLLTHSCRRKILKKSHIFDARLISHPDAYRLAQL